METTLMDAAPVVEKQLNPYERYLTVSSRSVWCEIVPKRVALIGPEQFDSSIGVSTIRQPPQSP
jgi:hypothetical protein